jgi:hypothetical protein
VGPPEAGAFESGRIKAMAAFRHDGDDERNTVCGRVRRRGESGVDTETREAEESVPVLAGRS